MVCPLKGKKKIRKRGICVPLLGCSSDEFILGNVPHNHL